MNNAVQIEGALKDFENILDTNDMRDKERELLEAADAQQEHLLSIERISYFYRFTF